MDNKCPICKAKPNLIQPQSSLHAFTTVYSCGSRTVNTLGEEGIEYEHKCTDPGSYQTLMEKLLIPTELKIIYSDQKISSDIMAYPKSIFLAGPTPRDKINPSWRPEAIRILKERNFKGTIFVPEFEVEFKDCFDFDEQIDWEHTALKQADIIVFWVPRDLKTMPAFTTNIEWGYWCAKNPSKLVFGTPKDAPKMRYLQYYAEKLGIPSHETLEDTLAGAVNKMVVK